MQLPAQLPILYCRHRVQRLAAFGSVLKAAFNAESDPDFIVTFEPMPPPYTRGSAP
jgi:predicted nucleotidyltransferase